MPVKSKGFEKDRRNQQCTSVRNNSSLHDICQNSREIEISQTQQQDSQLLQKKDLMLQVSPEQASVFKIKLDMQQEHRDTSRFQSQASSDKKLIQNFDNLHDVSFAENYCKNMNASDFSLTEQKSQKSHVQHENQFSYLSQLSPDDSVNCIQNSANSIEIGLLPYSVKHEKSLQDRPMMDRASSRTPLMMTSSPLNKI